jgi:hypothetical protein
MIAPSCLRIPLPWVQSRVSISRSLQLIAFGDLDVCSISLKVLLDAIAGVFYQPETQYYANSALLN